MCVLKLLIQLGLEAALALVLRTACVKDAWRQEWDKGRDNKCERLRNIQLAVEAELDVAQLLRQGWAAATAKMVP